MNMVTGDITCLIFVDMTRLALIDIPDMVALTIICIASLNLISTCRCSPQKVLWKLHMITLPFFVFFELLGS